MFSNILKIGAMAASIALSTSAFAAKPVSPPPPSCSVVTFSVATLSCMGFYSGNLVAESGPKLTQALGYVDNLDPGATSLLEKIEWNAGQDPYTIDFTTPLSGKSIIGIYFGGGNTGYNGTGFWLLDLPNNTDTISYSSNVQKGISNAGLYMTGTPAVPEPSTWAMMLLGFGVIAGAMRTRVRKPRSTVSYA